ncbi:hypothetical protein BKA70DRAFT_1566997 [Coprinopsis sp. MPI-PUGE-AT-0042]|nr:hypothetical protein BKA70DRAFT_1566997 [Coprinopsis sp. MPI-PUGE-AT-0042]
MRAEHESFGAGGGRGARHASPSARTSTILSGACDVRIADSTLTIVGGDVYNYNIHNLSERPRDIWAILKSIPNFRKIYQDMLSKATPGTGMWLVRGDKFRVWLEPNGDIKIFWGSGIPGAGKTLLASIVIEHLEALRQSSDAEICVCYVYFRYSDRSEVTVRNILETLVKQTLERHPGCLSVIDKTYTQHLREGTEPTEAQLLALLRELADNMSCTFYILDALDEAPTRIQLAVVRALASLNVKLFITSRPLKTVEAHFPQAHTFHIIAQDIDIDLHITKGIDENAELQRLLLASPLLRDEIFSTIKQNCGGMFLHASLQLDALHDCINADQVRRRLKGFPSKIEDVYLQTWDRILAQSADLVSVAKAVLVWVLHAARSMTVQELERAVATSPDTHRFEPDRFVPGATLMSLCRGLISLEEESRIVRLVHYTAKEMLETLLHESFPHPHSVLAAICIAHLTECGFQNTTIGSEDEFKAALNKDPLLCYASEAWAFHAVKSLDVDASKRQTAKFVNESKTFPAFTSLGRDRRFDILTPLHIAGLYDLPLALLEDAIKGDPNVTTGLNQQSPLMVASWYGTEDLVAHLIPLSATQVNLVDNDGWPALVLAADEGHEGVVKLLLAHPKIQVNIANRRGWSALMLAAYRGSRGVVEHLLVHPDILINLVDNDGWSAIILAAQRGHEGVVQLLLAHPEIQVNLVNNSGWSALTWAAHEGHKGVAKLLLAHPGIQVNLVNNDGWSAPMAAVNRRHEGLAKLLLVHSETQVNIVDNDGWSVLIWAAYKGREGLVERLLGHPDVLINLGLFGSVYRKAADAPSWPRRHLPRTLFPDTTPITPCSLGSAISYIFFSVQKLLSTSHSSGTTPTLYSSHSCPIISQQLPYTTATPMGSRSDATNPTDYLHRTIDYFGRKITPASILAVYDASVDNVVEDGRGWVDWERRNMDHTHVLAFAHSEIDELQPDITYDIARAVRDLRDDDQTAYIQQGLGLILDNLLRWRKITNEVETQTHERHHEHLHALEKELRGSASRVNDDVGKLSRRVDRVEEEMRGSVCGAPALSQTLQKLLERVESLERLTEVLRADDSTTRRPRTASRSRTLLHENREIRQQLDQTTRQLSELSDARHLESVQQNDCEIASLSRRTDELASEVTKLRSEARKPPPSRPTVSAAAQNRPLRYSGSPTTCFATTEPFTGTSTAAVSLVFGTCTSSCILVSSFVTWLRRRLPELGAAPCRSWLMVHIAHRLLPFAHTAITKRTSPHAAANVHTVIALGTVDPRVDIGSAISYSNDGWSALVMAAGEGHKGVVKLLLAHPNIQTDIVNNYGWSALMAAVGRGHEGVAELLLAHPKVQVNLVNNNGWSALMWAAHEGHVGVAKLLLADPEIQVNLVNNHGSTALLLAARYGHIQMINLLLTTGAFDVNAFDKCGDTAIKLAAEYGHEAAVRLLLDVPNVDIRIRNTTDGHTAMEAAHDKGHRVIVEVLRDFERRQSVKASAPEISQLNEDGSDSDSEEAYYDAEEGDNVDVSLGPLIPD